MSFTFSIADIQRISGLLGVSEKFKGNNYRWEIDKPETGRRLVLEIYPSLQIGQRTGNLVTVYTPTSHLQLHFCTGYVLSEMLGEVTFVGEVRNKLSGLIVEREGGCSLYANVDRDILSGDFTTLGPEVMLSGIALSLTETILPSPTLGAEKKSASTAGKRRKVGPPQRLKKTKRKQS
jgi:hypothetical protein